MGLNKDSDLTGEDVLGLSSGGVCLSSLSLSLFGCVVRKFIEGKMQA